MSTLHRNQIRSFTCEPNGSFMEFHTDAEHCFAFNMHQLIHYSIEKDVGRPFPDAPPVEKISMAFSTADVTLIGWRFDILCEDVRYARGGIIKILPAGTRYTQLETRIPYVTSMTIEPVKEK